MRHVVLAALLAVCFIQPTFADDPGPLAPCYQLLSDGWEVLRLRNAGMTLEEMETKINGSPRATAEQKAAAIEFVREVWTAPGDGWDWIGDKHRACIKKIRYGE